MFILRAELQHLAIVSWAVPSERLAPMLPSALEPDPIDDAGKWAIVSMAAMWDTTGHETYSQVNERAYVRKKDGTDAGAYFWKSHANSAQAELFRWLLGIPEFNDDVEVKVPGDGTYTCTFDRRPVLQLDLGRRGPIPQSYRQKGINDQQVQRAWNMSKNPQIGYTLDWGELCETPVRHDTIVGRAVKVRSVDPSFMVPSITIDKDQEPIFVAYQERTPFYIALPPRPVAGWCSLLSKLFYGWRV